jgi:hypothetical protein
MNKTVQTAIRLEYTMLRAPLTLLDRQVVSRLDEHSVIRSTFERGLDTLDAAAARFLETPPVRPPARPSTPTGDRAGERRPVEEPPAEEVEHLAEEFIAEQEQHNLAGELAEDEELRRVQAELRAKHQLEELEEQQREDQQRGE